MWTTGSITHTGGGDAGATTGAGTEVGWDFAPADGATIDGFLVEHVTGASRRIVLATMVLTSHPLLAALAAALACGVAVTGIYDGGQMGPIAKDWAAHPASATVLADWHTVSAHLGAKHSTPYSPTAVHDFMHNKILVADNTLATGSYNLSANAQHNAENQLHIHDRHLADQYVSYIDTITTAYRPT